MRTIPLTQGKVAIVDDDAPAWIFEVKWCAIRRGKCWHAQRHIILEDGRGTSQYMHRVVLNAKPGEIIDHKDGNGLDNRKENLRVTSSAGNQRGFNKRQINNTSGFRGVGWNKGYKKFEARVTHARKLLLVGYFSCPIEGARARDAKARELGWPEEGMNFPI